MSELNLLKDIEKKSEKEEEEEVKIAYPSEQPTEEKEVIQSDRKESSHRSRQAVSTKQSNRS